MSEQKKTSIGGQAVLEGVMMRGPFKTAVAVRKSDGEIVEKIDDNGSKKGGILRKVPIVRGCINFFDSLITGMKYLMFSAEQVDIEDDSEQKGKFDKWLENKFGEKMKDVVIYFSVILSIFLSVGLFILLPTVVTRGAEWVLGFTPLDYIAKTGAFTSIVEGVVRMLIFIGYLYLVSKMEDIKRVFEYHGAEHKTIACYEHGEELTVENVKKHSRLHPRCGTSFLLFVMIISIILFALLPKTGIFYRVVMRILLLPVVAGVSYEIIKWAGKSDNCIVGALSKPGLWLQKITTREPDSEQIEIAITAMKAVIPENSEEDKW